MLGSLSYPEKLNYIARIRFFPRPKVYLLLYLMLLNLIFSTFYIFSVIIVSVATNIVTPHTYGPSTEGCAFGTQTAIESELFQSLLEQIKVQTKH